MKLKLTIPAALMCVFVACGNGDEEETKTDSANTLNDTFPSGSRIGDTVGLDSNPADNTLTDSLNTNQ